MNNIYLEKNPCLIVNFHSDFAGIFYDHDGTTFVIVFAHLDPLHVPLRLISRMGHLKFNKESSHETHSSSSLSTHHSANFECICRTKMCLQIIQGHSFSLPS